jgi:enoyl-CoA hydratase
MLVQLDIDDPIGYLTLNRPEALNAISQRVLDDLEAALHAVASEKQAQVVILRGAGRAFCAGSDIKEFHGVSPEEAERRVRREAEVCRLFEEIPQPTIAALEGYALGGGVAIALYQNLRIASETAQFGFPETRMGWNPAFGMSRLTRLIGPGRAGDLMLTGRIIPAPEAFQMGLVDRLTPPNRLMETARETAMTIAGHPPAGIQAIKRIMLEETLLSNEEADDYELRVFRECVGSDEAQERIQEFINRKKSGAS